MKTLENTIELSKRELGSQNIATLIKRENNVAIYKRGISIFEVFKVREQKYSEQVIGGVNVIFEEKELYPSSEQFGNDAYCCSNLEQAEKRFEQLLDS